MGFKVDILTTSVNIKIGYERIAKNFLKEWMQKGFSYTGKIEIMYGKHIYIVYIYNITNYIITNLTLPEIIVINQNDLNFLFYRFIKPDFFLFRRV